MPTFDVLIIGAGPGGYVCAFRAAQLGLNVALAEKRTTLGGTCLNVGCIPSKALLHSSELYATAKHHLAAHGISTGEVKLDLPSLLKKKDAVVSQLTKGVAALAKARKITVLTGIASFVNATTVKVGDQEVSAKHIVIATGSAPAELPFLKPDGERIITSDHAIALDKVPAKLVVVGGGAIGLELGSVWSRLGSEVTIVEFLPKIAATYDDDIVRHFTRSLQKQGLKIDTNTKVTGVKLDAPGQAILLAERDGKPVEYPADKILLSTGRRPYTDSLALENAGLKLDDRKRIPVDAHLRTAVPHIYAIGDVIAGPMLAHKAEEDGVAVANWIAGKHGHIDWDNVPGIIYTDPEAASVGLGEDAAKAKNIPVKIGKFNLAANGRAIAADATDGFVKIIAHAETDKLLGAQIVGKNAGELLSAISAHMAYGGSAEDLALTIHAHPTMSEAVKEAALAVSKSALHAI